MPEDQLSYGTPPDEMFGRVCEREKASERERVCVSERGEKTDRQTTLLSFEF